VKRIAVFASGNGSNTKNIYSYFLNSKSISVSLVASNCKESLVVRWAEGQGLPICVFTKNELNSFSELKTILTDYGIDFIVLAGFLLKIPSNILSLYKNKVLNIHPSLLPLYGGKGMYGRFVHEAVLKNKEEKTGVTVHLVNEKYDDGKILFQKSCPVRPGDSVDVLAKRVLGLEHRCFPVTIEKYISSWQL
jgi:phosphoribosylglycinamide formyltransferase-1